MVPEVHVVGSESSGCTTLVQAILAASSQPATSLDGPSKWLIDNKYYTAEVQLRIVHVGEAASDSESSLTAPEAVVLVVDATSQDSFTSVQSWADKHPSEEAGVRLVVATHSDALLTAGTAADQTQRPAWLQACRDWCTDALYEYIEVCCTDASIDKQLRLDGEEQGVARVVAALHAHMWPGLVRKHKEAASVMNASAIDADNSQHVHVQISSTGTTKPKGDTTADPGAVTNGAHEDADNEATLDMYEALMDELGGVKMGLSTCDDDTRRTRAAELALRFAALLGEESDDDVPSDSSDAVRA